jgi:hypothetical protein
VADFKQKNMNKSTFLLISGSIFGVSGLYAQADGHTYTVTNKYGQEVEVSRPVDFMITPALRDWPETVELVDVFKEGYEVKQRRSLMPVENAAGEYTDVNTIQSENGTRQMRAPIVSWNGMSGSGYPPDPSGAAGPNHYVQAVNTSWRVFNKNGTPANSQASLSTLWSGSQNLGDPIVMYDRHADRWFISQFRQSPSNGVLLAVSTSSDPMGTYYAYSFNLTQFPDYPKYSIWWDGYYATSNSNKTAIVFNRSKMLAGNSGAEMIALSATGAANQGFRSVLPADADGDLPPNGTPCYFFNIEDDAWTGVTQDQLRIFNFTTDWVTTSNTAITLNKTLAVSSLDINFSGGFANIAQPGVSQKIDAIQQVLMYRVQYMRWVSYSSVVLSCAVDLGSNRSGIRWWELRDANNGDWQIFQESTYAPDGTGSRWMSSIAMDNQGNIGMGYSHTDPSGTIYPGIRYTGRYASDALNTMTVAETIAISGTGSQTATDRYGDYAHMSLDPDGTTFWYTGEYLISGNPRTRIFSFNLQNSIGIEENPFYKDLSMTAVYNAESIITQAKGIFESQEVVLDVIDFNGKTVMSANVKPVGGAFSHTFNAGQLAAGVYFVRFGNNNFQKVQRVVVTK